MSKTASLGALFGAALCSAAFAQTPTFPLPMTTGNRTSMEGTAPFLLPAGVTQTLLTDRQSLQGLPSTFGNWDMVTYDATGRYVFIPAEVGTGAGVFRYDTVSKAFLTLMLGNNTGKRESDPAKFDASKDDFARLDPATLTPWNTVITGEETTGGRLFEIMNPMANSNIQVLWQAKIPAVAHEGLRFDKDGALYFVDEYNSGSIYKYVPVKKGDLSNGQTFVLSVDAFAAHATADAAKNWNDAVNRSAMRFGAATWVPITDANGNALTKVDPFAFVNTTGGRDAADEVGGTPYGRPEDLDMGVLENGNEVVYCAITSENRVLSIELVSATKAIVRVFVDFDTINQATGYDVNPKQNDPYTSAGPSSETNFRSPDNLCVDHYGNVYVIEDQNPGDIWKCFDANRDGIAESMALFASLGVAGSEPTGMIAHPTMPGRFILCVQHPSSNNDALWQFDAVPYAGTSMSDLMHGTGVNRAPHAGAGEFVRSARPNDLVTFEVVSPKGDFVGSPWAVLAQGISTAKGPMELLSGIWLDPQAAIITLDLGILPYEGKRFWWPVPAGLEGVSLVTQAVAIKNNQLHFSNANEVRLVK